MWDMKVIKNYQTQDTNRVRQRRSLLIPGYLLLGHFGCGPNLCMFCPVCASTLEGQRKASCVGGVYSKKKACGRWMQKLIDWERWDFYIGFAIAVVCYWEYKYHMLWDIIVMLCSFRAVFEELLQIMWYAFFCLYIHNRVLRVNSIWHLSTLIK